MLKSCLSRINTRTGCHFRMHYLRYPGKWFPHLHSFGIQNFVTGHAGWMCSRSDGMFCPHIAHMEALGQNNRWGIVRASQRSSRFSLWGQRIGQFICWRILAFFIEKVKVYGSRENCSTQLFISIAVFNKIENIFEDMPGIYLQTPRTLALQNNK